MRIYQVKVNYKSGISESCWVTDYDYKEGSKFEESYLRLEPYIGPLMPKLAEGEGSRFLGLMTSDCQPIKMGLISSIESVWLLRELEVEDENLY